MLVHGWAMNNLVWNNWLALLEQSFRVICVELPGHGNSEYNEPWQMSDLLEMMAAQLPQQCSFLGWSLGGLVALAYADHFPKRVNRLVMLASTPKFVQSADWQPAQSKAVFDVFSNHLKRKPLPTMKRFVKLQTDGGEPSQTIERFLKSVLQVRSETSTKGLISGLDILSQADYRLALKKLNCPTMLLLGEKDQLVPVEVADEFAQINPRVAVCVIEGATHVPFLSHPNEVSQELVRFMSAGDREL